MEQNKDAHKAVVGHRHGATALTLSDCTPVENTKHSGTLVNFEVHTQQSALQYYNSEGFTYRPRLYQVYYY